MNRIALLLFSSILITLFFGTSIYSHDQREGNYKDILNKADAVAIGLIIKKQVNNERCSTRTVYFIKSISYLKGSIPDKDTFQFYYTVHYWKRATFPWQEDCPSVHYMVPPKARTMEKGTRLIITIQHNDRNSKSYYISSTKDMKHLDEVKKLLKKK